MPSKLNIQFVDHDNERSTVFVRGDDVTAANFDTQEGLLDDIVAAIEGVTLGTRVKDERTYALNEGSDVLPASAFAQRETKWLVSYADTVDSNGNGSFEIPTADLALKLGNTQNMNVASGAGLALVTALEAGMVSKLGNPITITRIIHVGRNI